MAGRLLATLDRLIPFDPAVRLLDSHPEEPKPHVHTEPAQTFTAALLITA